MCTLLSLVLLCASSTLTLAAGVAKDTLTPDATRAVEKTFLKSLPGQRDHLRRCSTQATTRIPGGFSS